MKYSRTDMRQAVISPTFSSTNDAGWNKTWRGRLRNIETLEGGKRKKSRARRKKNKIPQSYKKYIKSKYWRRRRKDYYRKHGKKCAVCKTSKYVQLHHKVYGNYGREPDDDLVALCNKHHEDFHNRYGVSKNMKEETDAFISSALFDEEAWNVMRNL